MNAETLLKFIEPDGASVQEGYVCIENVRGYQAIKGSGLDRFEWLEGSPFLLVVAPELNIATRGLPWHARSLFTLNYVVGRFAE